MIDSFMFLFSVMMMSLGAMEHDWIAVVFLIAAGVFGSLRINEWGNDDI